VYGAFPDSGEDLFISPSLVEGAMGRALEIDPLAPITVGVDPARFGADSTVIVVRQGAQSVRNTQVSGRRHYGDRRQGN